MDVANEGMTYLYVVCGVVIAVTLIRLAIALVQLRRAIVREHQSKLDLDAALKRSEEIRKRLAWINRKDLDA